MSVPFRQGKNTSFPEAPAYIGPWPAPHGGWESEFITYAAPTVPSVPRKRSGIARAGRQDSDRPKVWERLPPCGKDAAASRPVSASFTCRRVTWPAPRGRLLPRTPSPSWPWPWRNSRARGILRDKLLGGEGNPPEESGNRETAAQSSPGNRLVLGLFLVFGSPCFPGLCHVTQGGGGSWFCPWGIGSSFWGPQHPIPPEDLVSPECSLVGLLTQVPCPLLVKDLRSPESDGKTLTPPGAGSLEKGSRGVGCPALGPLPGSCPLPSLVSTAPPHPINPFLQRSASVASHLRTTQIT